MNIGILREYKGGRVLITPETAKKLIESGNNVFFTTGCGYESGYKDTEYLESGCIKKFKNEDVIKESNIITTYKLPKIEEIETLRSKQILICYSNCVSNIKKINSISRLNATLIALEYLTNRNKFEISQVISKLAANIGTNLISYIYNNPPKGKGRTIESYPFTEKTKVSIIGFGNLGKYVTAMFLKKNCTINVFEKDVSKFNVSNQRLNYGSIYDKDFNSKIEKSNIVISTVSEYKNFITPFIKKEIVEKMNPRSIIFDFSINSGGSFETSKKTQQNDMFYLYENIIHCCPEDILENIPETISSLLSKHIVGYILKLANGGIRDSNFRKAIIVYNGKIVKDVKFIEEKIDYSLVTDPFDLMDDDISLSWKMDDINEYLEDINDYNQDDI